MRRRKRDCHRKAKMKVKKDTIRDREEEEEVQKA